MKGLAIEGLGCETVRFVATVQEPRNTPRALFGQKKNGASL